MFGNDRSDKLKQTIQHLQQERDSIQSIKVLTRYGVVHISRLKQGSVIGWHNEDSKTIQIGHIVGIRDTFFDFIDGFCGTITVEILINGERIMCDSKSLVLLED